MNDTFPAISRSNRFILYFQLEGVCQALRLAVQVTGTQIKIDDTTLNILNKIVQDFKEMTSGKIVEGFQNIDHNCTLLGALTLAETLRTTMLSFMTTEEINEQQKTFGFKRTDV